MKSKQYIYLAILSASLTTTYTSQADTLAITAGAGIWNASPTGNIQKNGDPTSVDVEFS